MKTHKSKDILKIGPFSFTMIDPKDCPRFKFFKHNPKPHKRRKGFVPPWTQKIIIEKNFDPPGTKRLIVTIGKKCKKRSNGK